MMLIKIMATATMTITMMKTILANAKGNLLKYGYYYGTAAGSYSIRYGTAYGAREHCASHILLRRDGVARGR